MALGLWAGRLPPAWMGYAPWPLAAWVAWKGLRVSAGWSRPARLAALGVAGALLITALAPLTGWDALAYHFALPKLFLRDPGAFWDAYDHRYAFIPFLGEMLFTASLGASEASALLWLPLAWLACLWSVHELSGRSPWAVVLFLAGLPLAKYAASGYVDTMMAASVGLALVAYLRWRDGGSRSCLVACGILSGAAAALKLTGLPFLALMLLAIPRRPWALVSFALPAALVAAPWPIRSWIATGNPIYPLGASVWGGPFLNLAADYTLGRSPGIRDALVFSSLTLLSAPWLAVLLLGRLRGPLPRLPSHRIVWWTTVVLVPVWFLLAPVEAEDIPRYALPYTVPACAWAAVVMERLAPGRLLRLAAWAAVVFCVLWTGLRALVRIPVVLGLESREAFLSRRTEAFTGRSLETTYPAVSYLNALARDGKTVRALLAGCRGYHLDVPYREAHEYHGYFDYREGLDGVLAKARSEGLTHVLVERAPGSGSRAFRSALPRPDLLKRVYESPSGDEVYEILSGPSAATGTPRGP